MGHTEIETTETELDDARHRSDRLAMLLAGVGLVVVVVATTGAAAAADQVADGRAAWVLTGLFACFVGVPNVIFSVRAHKTQAAQTEALMDSLRGELTDALHTAEEEATRRDAQARRQQFETRLANALEMAEGEPEVIDVVERAFASTMPDAPAELLLADNSHAHLTRMARSAEAPSQAMCAVDSPDHCPAARRAQVQRFDDSDALDACPKLRHREGGRCSAVCVPVSIMGRTVGVIHATGAPLERVDATAVQDLGTLANLAGARIGLLRMVADTQLQASTDSLTGLLNRRSLEQRFLALRQDGAGMSVVMADLDNFKVLNDTHGHETGDRALRLFARTLSTVLRTTDVVCRHGGEEFAVLLPGCGPTDAVSALEKVRTAMADAVTRAGLPKTTASFGLVEADPQEDLPDVLARADVALFQAKREGRDRVVLHDANGAVQTGPQGLALIV
jgi:diguanylate cyclase (GGDEF)-like protein